MKKNVLLLKAVLLVTTMHAQVYTQGDVTVTLQPVSWHDTLACANFAQMFYDIVIQNSFVGDTVIVYNPAYGRVLFEASNTTGQNPWMLSEHVFDYISRFDNEIVNGLITFTYPDTKVISGSDTVYVTDNFHTLARTNPCVYYDVTGKVYADYNDNCIFDSTDVGLGNMDVWGNSYMTPPYWSYGNHVDTDSLGNYVMVMQQSHLENYSVGISWVYQYVFQTSWCSAYRYDSLTVLPMTIDFAVQCGNTFDLQTFSCTPISARPLIPFILFPRVVNTGCTEVSGTLNLVLDSRVTYNAALSPNPPNSVNGDTLTWNFSNLNNLISGGYWNGFSAGVHLTPDISVNIGDTLCFPVFTQVPSGDINPANNSGMICIPVVNSFDPNMIEVSPQGEGAQGFIPEETEELIYTIHFQNTGNAPALNITVRDSLTDPNIIPESMQILGASHNMVPGRQEEELYFTFSSINLPDSTTNEPESHGFVRFKVKLKPGLTPGTEIKNQARIYFDTNPPIYTNTALNTIVTPPTGISPVTATTFELFPNPAANMVTLAIDESMIGSSVVVTDITGKKVQTIVLMSAGNQLSTEGFANGVYLVTFTRHTDGSSVNKKLFIQR